MVTNLRLLRFSSAVIVPFVEGSVSAPTLITAAGGITSGAGGKKIIYIAGDGGAIDIIANPQISAGSINGQELILIGSDAVNTVKIQDGNGLKINGTIVLGLGDSIHVIWDTDQSLWREEGRS